MTAGRCGVTLPEAKALKERVASGRRLAEAIRAAVPGSKDGTRPPRGKVSAATAAAAEPLDADFLRFACGAARYSFGCSSGLRTSPPSCVRNRSKVAMCHFIGRNVFSMASRPMASMGCTGQPLWKKSLHWVADQCGLCCCRRSLKAEASTLQVELPEMSTLSDALMALSSWQRRAREALGVAAPLAHLQSLALEAHSLPAAAPEQSAVQVCLIVVVPVSCGGVQH